MSRWEKLGLVAGGGDLPRHVAEACRADGRLGHGAGTLRPAQLRGEMTWWSGAEGAEVTRPRALCVAHLFNHQTHHRGQVHAMLTAAGLRPPATDLALMPVASAGAL